VREFAAPPLLVRLHGPAFLTLSEEAERPGLARARIELEGEALRRAAALVSPSECALRCTAQRYRLDPPIKAVIPNPLRAEGPRWELERCERKTLLFVGRFDRVKGGDTALIAFRRLLEADAELKLVFIGPNAGVDEFCGSLFTPAQRRSVQFLGMLPAAEIRELRTRAAATLVLSRWETQGYTALEAMLQGCPLIVSDAGALSEVVQHGATGLVARLEDIDDLCAKVRRLLDDPLAAREMGRNAQRFVAERHSPRHIAERALGLYARVLAC
jgi:glycosyltransferase involved in cell wall biosynthesis